MKRKMILFAALVAASSTAFVACSSSDDDVLAQAPAAPVAGETVVEESVVVGTPFSVAPSSGNTRAVRYGSSAWGDYVDDSTPYVTCFKLYGKQSGLAAWINNVVFTRVKTGEKANIWGANRDDDGDVATVNWPVGDNADVATNFYAITDNAIKGQSDDNSLTGVHPWMDTEGAFAYAMQQTSVNIPWDDTGNPGSLANADRTIVDPANMRDLMYATTCMKESDTSTSGGALPLKFHHALSGLSIKAKFLSNGDYSSTQSKCGWAKVKAVAIRGLKTAGTFTMTPVNQDPEKQVEGGTGVWSDQSTLYDYYYAIPDKDQEVIYAQSETTSTENVNIYDLVPVGEWFVVPQTTIAWDEKPNGYALPAPTISNPGAYIIIHMVEYNEDDKDIYLCYPLDTTLNPGKTRVITIDLALGREYWSSTSSAPLCDYHFEPSIAGGSRQLKMESEEF